MSTTRHVILNHIDTPLKILFWTKGDLLLFLGPFFGGMIIDELFAGIVLSLLNMWVAAKYKRRFGKGKLEAVMYWYLPHNRSLKTTPPSFIREYLG